MVVGMLFIAYISVAFLRVFTNKNCQAGELKEYVEINLNPLEKKELLRYTAIRYGGPEPVADIPCAECGEYGVSILDDFYPVGHFCYYGEENYIKQCNKCGKWYEDNGENDTICNECLEEIFRK